MEVDTGTFRAIQARADAADELRAEVCRLAETGEVFRAYLADKFLASTFIQLGRELERHDAAGRRQAPGPRHARPRGERPGYLRLVGGDAR